jgi:trans-2,3-dihydro-3-hydroxyanthranilate isomerase
VRFDLAAAESGVSVFSWSPETREAHARVFVPGESVWEDPATGSAALGLGVWLVASGLLPGDGVSSYRVHQGHEMRRPSLLDCTVTAASGVASAATVAGHVYPIARGEIAVPPFVG